jgi:hypothetical protein
MLSKLASAKYCKLFLHNNLLYIIHSGKTWLTEKRLVTPDLISKHLERKITIGLQPSKPDGTVKWLAIDFDAHNDEPKEELQENVIKTKENLTKLNIDSHIEQSGRGYHLWIFFEKPILRENIEDFIKKFVYHSAEIYAGKTKIRIPLGSYQKDKSIFCGFLDENFTLIENQEKYLLNIKPTSLDTIKEAKKRVKADNLILNIKPVSKDKKRKVTTNFKWYIKFDKEKKNIPKKPEIDKNKIIGITTNAKHKFILQLLLDMNLSPREIRNMRIKDIRIEEQILEIAERKGNKRKMMLIPGHLINSFKENIADKEQNDLLLMSNRDKPYSLRTIVKIKENKVKKLAPRNK